VPNGFDVAIDAAQTNKGGAFIIYNFPTGSSGDYQITSASNIGTNKTFCSAIFDINEPFSSQNPLGSINGTITKTTTNSFSFTCTVNKVGASTNIVYTVTGSGVY